MDRLIPADFARRMIELYGERGRAWITALPQLVAECEAQSGLVVGPAFELSYNYAASAEQADGTAVVLKLRAPQTDDWNELQALRHYAGRGCAQVLAADAARGVLLLERLRPGAMLSILPDDEATAIAAEVMAQLWKPPPTTHSFPSVDDWMAALGRLRAHYGGGTGPFPPALVDRAERLYAELRVAPAAPMLLHGDLHHYNILSAGRAPWLAIDPQGVIGEPAYEAGALLRNPSPGVFAWPDLAQRTARRVAILAERTGLDRWRLAAWGLAGAVLSVWWTVEDHGTFDYTQLRVAEALSPLV